MVQMIKKKILTLKAVVEKGAELIYLFYPHMNQVWEKEYEMGHFQSISQNLSYSILYLTSN